MNKILHYLSILKPEKYLLPQIKNYDGVIDNFYLLKNCIYSEKLFNFVLKIIVEKSKQSKKFRKIECFKIIKIQKKKADKITNNQAVDNIFFLFKKYINSVSDDTANSLSVALKDLVLEKEQIEWLIKNTSNSFVLNRVLRYPIPSKEISLWALEQLRKNEHFQRKSELIGRVLDFDTGYSNEDVSALAWGVYYSRTYLRIKKQILVRLHDHNVSEEVVRVIVRLGLVDILEKKL